MTGRAGGSRLLAVATLVALLVPFGVIAGTDPAGAQAPRKRVVPDHVLVVSVPRLGWDDVVPADMPTLVGLADAGATGALSVRALGRDTGVAEGYATLGAGNRMTAPDDALSSTYAKDEAVEGSTAGKHLADADLRPPGPFVVPGVPSIQEDNRGTHQGAEVGALGMALHAAGWTTAAIADPGDWAEARGSSGLAAVDRQGGMDDARIMPNASVAPGTFGAEPQRVARVVRDLPDRKAFAVLEVGEVARADAAHLDRADRRAAARRVDRLLAAAVDELDLARDLVVVLAPTHPSARPQPVPFVAVGPGIESGLARSATTRRAGWVTLTDVAPAILDWIGRPIPDSMNGTRITSVARGDADAAYGFERLTALGREVAEVRFVDRVQGKLLSTIPIYVGAWSLLLLGVTFLPLGRARRPAATFTRFAGLVLMSVPLMGLALGAAQARGWGQPAWFAVLFGGAIAIAALCEALASSWPDRRWLPAVGIAVVTWALYVVDLVTGGRLEFNSALGNSPTQGGRFVGLENRGFGVLMAGTLVLACVSVRGLAPPGTGERTGRRGARLLIAAAVVLVTLVVLGMPQLGSDVGGALVLGIVGVVVLWLLAGKRPTWWIGLVALAVGLASVALFEAYDRTRPEDDRSHLARFGADESRTETVVRKAAGAISTLWHSSMVWVVVCVAALTVIAWWTRRATVERAFAPETTARTLAVTGLLAGVLGAGLNDSGVAVPAMMAVVLVPIAVEVLVLGTPPPTPDLAPPTSELDGVADPGRAPEPQGRGEG